MWLHYKTEEEDVQSKFLALAGPDSPQRPVKIRDYYNDQSKEIHDFLQFELNNDDEQWKFFSRPVCASSNYENLNMV